MYIVPGSRPCSHGRTLPGNAQAHRQAVWCKPHTLAWSCRYMAVSRTHFRYSRHRADTTLVPVLRSHTESGLARSADTLYTCPRSGRRTLPYTRWPHMFRSPHKCRGRCHGSAPSPAIHACHHVKITSGMALRVSQNETRRVFFLYVWSSLSHHHV